jgi:hypothetical protein
MAKKLLLLSFFMLAVLLSYGQDLITRSDGVVIRARVLEMKPGLVLFKLFGQPDTLVYQISTQDLQAVRMADGTLKTFPEAAKKAVPFNYETSSGRNILWYYPFDLLYSNVTLAYERILAPGKVAIRVPLKLGLSPNDPVIDYYERFKRNIRYGAGLEVYYYPFGQGRFQPYVGPAFHFRSYRTYYYPPSPPGPVLLNAYMRTVALQLGIYYQFSRFFIASADTGLGLRYFSRPGMPANYNHDERSSRGHLPLNFRLGFRF